MMKPPQVHLTLVSSNAKTGPIPVSTTGADSCPPSCPFKKEGCYAESGPLALHWAAVTKRKRGLDWESFCSAIRALPAGTFWRHNQAGDLPGEGERINRQALMDLVNANKGKLGFTYTHKTNYPPNWRFIKTANRRGFTINLSANNLQHADQLADMDVAPVVTVLPAEQTKNTVTPAGRKVVVCPATQRDDVTCLSCQLCQKSNRSVIVGFPAHGASKKRAVLASESYLVTPA